MAGKEDGKLPVKATVVGADGWKATNRDHSVQMRDMSILFCLDSLKEIGISHLLYVICVYSRNYAHTLMHTTHPLNLVLSKKKPLPIISLSENQYFM